MTQKTIEYVNRFYVFDNVEAMDQLRFSLANAGMHEFEVGALMNLCPDSADEARALVMSLENIKEESGSPKPNRRIKEEEAFRVEEARAPGHWLQAAKIRGGAHDQH